VFEFRYFRRDGTEIGWLEYLHLWNAEYCRVAYTVLKDGTEVSTVWIGSNYGGVDPPLIFETMVFSKDGAVLGQRRYSTEAQALDGHKATVQEWMAHLN
jgi:hypothetical protein